MGGRSKPWFSPRAVVGPIKTGPNSYRYEARKNFDNELDESEDINSDFYASKFEYPSHVSWREKRKADREKTYNHALQAKPKFAWTPTRWSTFSFDSFLGTNVDDNSNLFVKEPESYVTPTVSEIRAKTNYWTDTDIRRIKEIARACYLKMIDDKDYIAEKFKNQEDSGLSEEAWNARKAIIDNVYEDFIPGISPLEQALAVNTRIRDADAANHKREYKADKYQSTYFRFRRENYADPVLNNQLEKNALSGKNKLEILDKISIIGELGTQFKVEKECGETEVDNSNHFKMKVMRDYDQLQRIEIYQRLFPNFDQKFFTKNLIVNVPVKTSELKQKIILIVDYSGSMDYENKQKWVNALLIDRFRYVIKGEAEIFFSFFVSSPNQLHFTHLKNEEDVNEFWKKFSNHPCGSFTDMGRIVTHISDEIIKRKRLCNLDIDLSAEKPEILIINDGQDEVGYKSFPYKVNAISLMSYSSELRKLCVNSGGKQVRIYEDGKIKTYAKEVA